MSALTVRPLAIDDFETWRELYAGYAAFYRRPRSRERVDRLWSWIHDPSHEVEGLGATLDGALVGLAHFRRMPRPLHGSDIGFLDDLYVAEAARRAGVGEALLERLRAIAAERDWSTVRWITARDNARAKRLYDRIGRLVPFELYEMDPSPVADSAR